MRPDRMTLSAYIDGEVPQKFSKEIEAELASDSSAREDYDALRRLRQWLLSEPISELDLRLSRGRQAIEDRLRDHDGRSGHVWRRQVSIPVPAFAAAGVVLVALIGVLVWSLLPHGDSMHDFLNRGKDVDVTIRVDGDEMEQVLQWLVDQNMLGEVNIQLPEQQFQIVGEPVLVKPAKYDGASP